jgi:hypothetical protein
MEEIAFLLLGYGTGLALGLYIGIREVSDALREHLETLRKYKAFREVVKNHTVFKQPRDKSGKFISKVDTMTEQLKKEIERRNEMLRQDPAVQYQNEQLKMELEHE